MRTMTGLELLATKPAWAKAALLAGLEHDKSEIMTDYFATSTSDLVFLGWSKHTKDLFSEMRKAAATFEPTAHLGPGKGVYKVYVAFASVPDGPENGRYHHKGAASPWHRDLYGEDFAHRDGLHFTTKAEVEAFLATAETPHDISGVSGTYTFEWATSEERIEHREKWSMGAGYYLKASGRYSTGWKVWKGAVYEHSTYAVPEPPATAPTAPKPRTTPTTEGATVLLNEEKGGVEIRFPTMPPAETRATLKAHGWRWSRFHGCWWHRDTPEARALAETIVRAA